MRHKSNNKTRPLFTLSLEMTRLVNETRLLLVPCFNSDIYGNNTGSRRPTTTTVRSNDTLVDTPFQLISGFFHVSLVF